MIDRELMSMSRPSGEALRERTKMIALRLLRLVEVLHRGRASDVLGRQLLRCATSVGANNRAACRARLCAEFIAKMGIVEDEADEAVYWMELIVEAGLMVLHRIQELIQEANEILAITVTSIKTARRNSRNTPKPVRTS